MSFTMIIVSSLELWKFGAEIKIFIDEAELLGAGGAARSRGLFDAADTLIDIDDNENRIRYRKD